MKKILCFVMVAVAFMACENIDKAFTPTKDKKAIAAVSADAPQLLDKTMADADKALKAAGFLKIEQSQAGMPSFRKSRRYLKEYQATEAEMVIYIYGVPENFQEMTQQEGIAYTKKLLKDGGSIVEAYVIGAADQVVAVQASVMKANTYDTKVLFLDYADKIYKALPAEEECLDYRWIAEIYDKGKELEFDNRAAYTAAVLLLEEDFTATEQGVGILNENYDGLFYGAGLYIPEAEKEEEEDEDEIEAPQFSFQVVLPSFVRM